MIKNLIKTHEEVRVLYRDIKKLSEDIRESVQANGVILDQLNCKFPFEKE